MVHQRPVERRAHVRLVLLAPEHQPGIERPLEARDQVRRANMQPIGDGRRQNLRAEFEHALATSDLAVVRYEYANAMLYINKRRDIGLALEQLKRASTTRPRFAMEALDAMYAAKRRREVEALAKSTVSFRSFERKRIRHMKDRNENLYCVLPNICKPFIVQ